MELRLSFVVFLFVFWGVHKIFFFFYLSSYFAPISLHTNFQDPRTIPSWKKVCVGGGWFEGKFSVSFGPKLHLGFVFGLGPSICSLFTLG